MTAVEASKIWGLSGSYVKTSLRQSKQKWPEGSYRKFGHTLVVTTAGMEAVTGIKDPRNWDAYMIINAFISTFLTILIWGKWESNPQPLV